MNSDIPKVLHEVCGQPILQYVLDVIHPLSAQAVYVVIGHKAQDVAKILDKENIVVRQKKLLGTADAIRSVQPYLKNYSGDILIVCGDTPFLRLPTLRNLVTTHKKSKAACTLLTATIAEPKGYGRVIRDARQKIIAIREEKDASEDERAIREINVGLYCLRGQDLFKTLTEIRMNRKKKEFYFTDIIECFVKKSLKIETIKILDPLEGLGINTREDLSVAQTILRQRIIKKNIERGVTIVDPLTTFIEVDAKIGKDTVIRPFSYIEKNVLIGRRCKIGPFARIRSGTRIKDEVEIGNFTEVSRTQIGKGSLMKHFSFLGDAIVGTKVNIGAGTVTANYDGKSKNKTIISDESFIGSDSVLIAPVKIGKRAVVGAGSVVTKGKVVPDGSVVMGVPARVISGGKNR